MKYGVEAEKYILVTDIHQKHIQGISLLALIVALYHSYFLSLPVFLGIAVLVVLTGLYAIPLLPRARNLRSLGGLKIFVVAVVWAGSTVILPVISVEQYISWDVQIETVQRFILVLILLVPFEIRDLAFDSIELITLPQRFGILNTKIIGGAAIVPFYCIAWLKDDVSTAELVANGIISLILGILIWNTNKERPAYFASFFVEAVPIFWWIILLIITNY